MNIKKSFIEWMEDNSFGVFGTDLYADGAPLDAPDACYWVTSGGGTPISKNATGEKQKNYILNIYHRDTDAESVADNLQELEELLNSKDCIDLNGYDVIEVSATTFSTDQDLDQEDRTVALLQATITAYQSD